MLIPFALGYATAKAKSERLIIQGIGPPAWESDDTRRIRFYNDSNKTTKFLCQLVKTEPAGIGHHIPAYLRQTGELVKGPYTIPPYGICEIDIFCDKGVSQPLELILMGSTNAAHYHRVPRDRSYKLWIMVYPAENDRCASAYRVLSIAPQEKAVAEFRDEGEWDPKELKN